MLSGSDSRGRAQPWQKSTEPLALTSTREVLWKIEDCEVKEWKDTGHSKASIEQKCARLRRVLEPLPYNDLVKRGLEFLYTKQSKRKIRYLVRKHLKET